VTLLSSAGGSQSPDNTKNDRIRQTPRKAKKTKLKDHLRPVRPSLNKKSVVDTKATSSVTNSISNVNSDLKCASCNGCLFSDNHDACVVAYINSVNASIKSKYVMKPVVQIVLWYLDSGCSKHMTGDRTQLINFVQKFLGTVKFGNDRVAKIMGYGDYEIGNVTISQGLVRGLPKLKFEKDHLCSACAMGKSTKKTPKPKSEDTNQEKLYLLHMDLYGPMRVESINGKNQMLRDYYEEVGISHETLVVRSPQLNGVVERRNRTLIEAARTISRPALHEMTPATISSGLVQKSSSSTPFLPLSRNDWDLLFQPMFDELLNPPPSVDHQPAQVIAPIAKALYGLKQAPCVWYDMLSSFLISQDFSKGSVDPTLFIHVDDRQNLIFLRITDFSKSRGIFINQSKYALESLKKYGFESCDPVDTLMVEKSKLGEDKEGKAIDPSHYRCMIGTLLYLIANRPDLQFPICMCARYQARPTEKHVHAVKKIFRYLRGAIHRGLWYPKDSSVALTVFADADHAGCQDTRHSTSGSVQFLGERLISWSSKRQKSAAISSIEAEYITLSGCCAQILWIRSQLLNYGLGFNKIPIYYFIKEQVENGVIELYFVNTEYQLADLFTKALDRDRIEFLINKLGMRSFTPETLKQLMDEEVIVVFIRRLWQFCDSDLEVAFRQHTFFIRNLEGVDLLTGSRGNNLYTLSLQDMMASSPICLLSKASKTKDWLWHRRLSHLNFGAINHLAKQGLVRGLPKLKFEKDHLCSACAMGKSTKKSYKSKSEDTNQEKLYLLHMDLCGPMRVESVNGKKYILDEAPDFIIKFLKMIQVRLKVPVRRIRTDNGTKFVNQTLREYYEEVGISHETSVVRSPQQNDIVERCNRTLIEAARTMLIYAQASLFLWAEAVATACYTQNRSSIRLRYGKKPYDLLHNKLHDLSFFHVFGALCYPTNDSENFGKLQPKADIGIFIGYAPTKKAFRIYNRRTRRIIETIYVDFDELTAMASEQSSLGPTLNEMTLATISSGLMQKSSSSTPYVPPSRNDWDLLFQPMFDELLNPPPSVDHQAPEVIALIADTTPETQSLSILKMLKKTFTILKLDTWGMIRYLVYQFQKLLLFNLHQRPVSTLLQLHEQALFCYYDAFLTLVEPKTYKDALTQSCWIEAMQEELNEFERLEASKTKSWLWHHQLSHLNFGAINHLARQGLVRGLPKLKLEKDHLCSACAMGKSTKKTHKPKSEDTNQEKLYLLYMDLCGPMRVESVYGKKYILVIVDDYSRFTWVKLLRSQDETSDFIIKFLKIIQVRLKVPVHRIRTNNGTEFVNQTLRDYYEEVVIFYETLVTRSPQQNRVIERRNRTLIKAAHTMLIYAQAPLFLWAEVVATACFTQNRSIIRLRHGKTPYELLHIFSCVWCSLLSDK
nr:hypothetical protein [Tanacetum cinerariifolium]